MLLDLGGREDPELAAAVRGDDAHLHLGGLARKFERKEREREREIGSGEAITREGARGNTLRENEAKRAGRKNRRRKTKTEALETSRRARRGRVASSQSEAAPRLAVEGERTRARTRMDTDTTQERVHEKGTLKSSESTPCSAAMAICTVAS